MDEAPAGKDWLHEIKYDGYRMHARIDGGQVKLLTRTGLDWSHRYRRTTEALAKLPVSYALSIRTARPSSAASRRQWTKGARISSSSSPSISCS